VDVSRKVLNNVELYMQWREALTRVNHLEDQLETQLPYMTPREMEAYTHITGMYEIANGRVIPERVREAPPAPQIPYPELGATIIGEPQ
jgi:hypothetical protein